MLLPWYKTEKYDFTLCFAVFSIEPVLFQKNPVTGSVYELFLLHGNPLIPALKFSSICNFILCVEIFAIVPSAVVDNVVRTCRLLRIKDYNAILLSSKPPQEFLRNSRLHKFSKLNLDRRGFPVYFLTYLL